MFICGFLSRIGAVEVDQAKRLAGAARAEQARRAKSEAMIVRERRAFTGGLRSSFPGRPSVRCEYVLGRGRKRRCAAQHRGAEFFKKLRNPSKTGISGAARHC
jgi:hypothetical protein